MQEQEILDNFLSLSIEHKSSRLIKEAINLGADINKERTVFRKAIKDGDTKTVLDTIDLGITPEARDLLSLPEGPKAFLDAIKPPIDEKHTMTCLMLLLTKNVVRELHSKSHLAFDRTSGIVNRLLSAKSFESAQKLLAVMFSHKLSKHTFLEVTKYLDPINSAPDRNYIARYDIVINALLKSNSLPTKDSLNANADTLHSMERVLLIGASQQQYHALKSAGYFTSTETYNVNGIRTPKMLSILEKDGIKLAFRFSDIFTPMSHQDLVALTTDDFEYIFNAEYEFISTNTDNSNKYMSGEVAIYLCLQHIAAKQDKTDFAGLVKACQAFTITDISTVINRAMLSQDRDVKKDIASIACYDIFIAEIAKLDGATDRMNIDCIFPAILQLGHYPAALWSVITSEENKGFLKETFSDLLSWQSVNKIHQNMDGFMQFITAIEDEHRDMLIKGIYRHLRYTSHKSINQLCAALNNSNSSVDNNSTSTAYLSLLLVAQPKEALIDGLSKARNLNTLDLLLLLLNMTPMDVLSDTSIKLSSTQKKLILQTLQ